uniref:Cytochrome c oxidase subunit 3 n=1 Tax=Centrorhynchus milvus TaxID=2594319 RepID=A0A515KYY8_9BILA|nr:cytochrome c oxidase subunit 3 [Centrorhynchus milvus]
MLVVSSWPLVVSLGVVFVMLGISAGYVGVMVLGASVALMGLLGWVGEDQVKGLWSVLEGSCVGVGAVGVLIFIFMEFCFFVALVASSLYMVDSWDEGVKVDMYEVPLLISLVLLSSGVSITLAHQSMHSGLLWTASTWVFVTVLLGVVFVAIQYGEWGTNWFSVTDGVGGSLFYLITGFHGMHVILGVGLNLLLLCMVMGEGLSAGSEWKSEGVVWYWHFVDVVWLFVFLTVYWYCM